MFSVDGLAIAPSDPSTIYVTATVPVGGNAP